MTPKITRYLVAVALLCSFTAMSQSVGIGTENPNANAILELVAPGNNQGLLVPRLSTTERTATTFTNNLSASDNGLMVYDEDENKFFFWINSQWVELATGNLSGLPDQVGQSGKFLATDGSSALWTNIDFNTLENIPTGLSDGDNVDDADADPANEIQDISSSGTAGNISLSSGSTLTLNVDDADADASNEFQDLTLSGNTLSLTNSASTIDLSPFSGTNTDNQTLGLTGSDLSITGGNTIDISSIDTDTQLSDGDITALGYIKNPNDADASTTNELNTGMSLLGTTIRVTDAGGTEGVDIGGTFATDTELAASDAADGDKSDTNEIQDISTTGASGNISLSDGSTLNLNVNDADASTTNELNTGMSLVGTTIRVTDAGGTEGVNIGGTFATDTELAASDAADGDKSDTNEIQDLTLSGSTLSMTGSSVDIDLSPFSGTNTDNQTLGLSGSNLSITGGNTIDISSIDTDTQLSDGDIAALGYIKSPNDADASTTNELNTGMSLVGTTIRVTDAGGTESVNIGGTFATDTELAASDAADGDKSDSNEIQDISTTGAAGNISLSDGSTLNLNINDADASTSNELNTGMSLVGTTIRVTDAGGTEGVNIGGTFATDTELAASDAADGDKSDTNEIQDISTTGAAGNISLSDGSTLNLNVNDADASNTNELQTLSRVGTAISLSGVSGSVSIADNDNSSSNEYNTGMSLSGTSIRVTDGGGTESVNIGGTFATDAELAASDAADGDKSSSNEYNTSMSLSGTSIRVTDGGGTRSVNIGGTFATDAELNSRTFDPSAFKATLSKNATIPVGGPTNLVFDAEVYDIDGSFDASGVYTAPEDGFYNFGGQLIFTTVPPGLVQIILTDGSTIYYTKAFAPNSIQSSISFSVDLRLTAGEKIGVAITNTTLSGEAQPIPTIATPDQTNFFFCGKRFN